MADDEQRPAITRQPSPEPDAVGSAEALWRELAPYRRTTRADTDYGVVLAYLRAMAEGSPPCSANTVRNYRMVLLRFLQWYAAYRYGRPLAEFAEEDVQAYQAFMRAPPADWISPKRVKNPANKRPFVQALSESEVRRNTRIITQLFDYLVEQGRIFRNPWRQSTPKGIPEKPPIRQERHFDAVMWQALWVTVERLEEKAETSEHRNVVARIQRQRWALLALYIPALRPDECANSRAGQLRRTRDGWWLHMPAAIAKGAKDEEIPVPQAFVDALARYRRFHGIHPALPRTGDPWPLVLSLDGRRRITTRTLYNIVVELLREVADLLEHDYGDSDRAATMRKASPHWLRHARATHLLEGEVPRRIVKSIMRHTNDSTLDQYIHADDQAKQAGAHVALEGLMPGERTEQ